MNKQDYDKYYQQGGSYVIPVEIFDELFDEMVNWKEEVKELNQKYLNAVADYETTMSELQELKKQIEEMEFIVGLRQKRNLISKFDKEYDEEDKKKNPNRDYAGIMPDAEEVYKRYYSMKKQQKEFIDYMNKIIEELECDDEDDEEMKSYLIQRIDTFKEILAKYKEIIGGKE